MFFLPTVSYKKVVSFIFCVLIYLALTWPVLAQTGDSSTIEYSELDEVVSSLSMKIVGIAAVVLVLAAGISLSIKKMTPGLKMVLFGTILGASVLSTAFLAGSTVYLNMVSSSGGPVHWHADFEIWGCGQEILLKKPTGFSNKIGTATLHEHDDKRIHLEGVVVHKNNASLGNFIRVIGGKISADSMTVPALGGDIVLADSCPNGQPAEFQVFVYRVNEDKTYYQQKITDPANFIIAPESQVPPGDCIIMELDTPKEKTDKMCRSFKVAKQIQKLGEEVFPNGN